MLSKCREAIKTYWSDKNGTTLVELMVTFALIGLFMTAATSMLTSSLQMFGRMQTTSSAVNVSDLILDKIAGEIAAADIPEADSTNGYYFWLEPAAESPTGKSRWVVFRNRSQSPIAIFAGESGSASQADMGKGQLFIKYYAVSKEGLKAVKEIDWHFDENVYMGYKITDLHFVQENKDAHPNVVTIYLTIRNDRTGFEYSSRRYAECYNYDGMYISERDDGQTNFPVDKNDGLTGAVEFEIKKTTGGGGEETEEPLPAGWVQLTIIHKVVTYNGIYSDVVLKEEVKRKKFDPYTPWIEAEPLPGPEAAAYISDKKYQQVPVSLSNPEVQYIYYYTPKETQYRTVAYNQETGERIKEGEVKTGLHGQEITVDAETIDGFEVAGEKHFTKALIWTDQHVDNGPNVFEFNYTPRHEMVAYTVYYQCGDILLGKDIGEGMFGDTIELFPKTYAGYTPKKGSVFLNLDNMSGCQYTFEYTMNEWNSGAPFPPVGPNIKMVIEAKTHREPTDLEYQIAQDIFRFFNEGWTNVEVWDKEHFTGAYKEFELNGTRYAVAGGTNHKMLQDSLKNKIEGQGILKGNIVEIKMNKLSNENDERLFLEYILKNAGFSDEYIQRIHSMHITFDNVDNPKKLKEVTFKNIDNEVIRIEYN